MNDCCVTTNTHTRTHTYIYIYIGNMVNSNTLLDDEIVNRIVKDNYAIGKLHNRLWNKRGIYLRQTLQSTNPSCPQLSCRDRCLGRPIEYRLTCLMPFTRFLLAPFVDTHGKTESQTLISW